MLIDLNVEFLVDDTNMMKYNKLLKWWDFLNGGKGSGKNCDKWGTG